RRPYRGRVNEFKQPLAGAAIRDPVRDVAAGQHVGQRKHFYRYPKGVERGRLLLSQQNAGRVIIWEHDHEFRLDGGHLPGERRTPATGPTRRSRGHEAEGLDVIGTLLAFREEDHLLFGKLVEPIDDPPDTAHVPDPLTGPIRIGPAHGDVFLARPLGKVPGDHHLVEKGTVLVVVAVDRLEGLELALRLGGRAAV